LLSGARLTNEEFFLLKNLAKLLGSENLDHSGGECYKGLTEGVKNAIGKAASTGTFPQVESADAILAIRADFYETHPVFGMVVNQAVKRNDAQMFVLADKKGKFGKLPNAKTLLAKPGLEVNLLNAMSQVLLAEGLAATDGVTGVEELKTALAAYTPEKVAAAAGVDAELIKTAARQLAAAKQGAILLAYGLPYTAQSKELGVAAANLAILSGLVDQEQAGLYVCGEKANSQGAIDLGVLPGANGLGAQAMLEAAATGNLGALYIVGEDPLTSYPDADKVEKALKGAGFVVVQDLFLSPTAQLADVVLPAASFAEKDGTFTNAERRIQKVTAGIKSPGDAKTDGTILTMLATALGGSLTYTGPAAIFSALAAEVSDYQGIDFNAIGPQGVVWGGESLSVTTKTVAPVAGGEALDAKYQLITGSSLYHSGTTSVHAKGPTSVIPEAFVEVGREDAGELKLAEGDLLTIKGNGAEVKLKVKLDNRLPKGVLFAPNHFAGTGLNRLYKGAASLAVEVSK
jgi:NADH-quinone oxidoreductase subunit G